MRQKWVDGFAIGASTLCLFHCLALPFLIAAMPALASALDADESWHLALLVFAIPSSALGLFLGLSAHGQRLPLAIGMGGLTMLFLGWWYESVPSAGVLITSIGSLLLVSAHIKNWRLVHHR